VLVLGGCWCWWGGLGCCLRATRRPAGLFVCVAEVPWWLQGGQAGQLHGWLSCSSTESSTERVPGSGLGGGAAGSCLRSMGGGCSQKEVSGGCRMGLVSAAAGLAEVQQRVQIVVGGGGRTEARVGAAAVAVLGCRYLWLPAVAGGPLGLVDDVMPAWQGRGWRWVEVPGSRLGPCGAVTGIILGFIGQVVVC
jgi:hypothetical protein